MGKLHGKAVVVTGASRGIGAEIAKLFAAEGGKVVCAARTLKEGEHPLEGSLEKTAQGIEEAGGRGVRVDAGGGSEVVGGGGEGEGILGSEREGEVRAEASGPRAAGRDEEIVQPW